MKSILAFAIVLALAASPTFAQQFKGGDIVIEKARARATPKGAEVGVGYLVIHNNGAAPDRLKSGSSAFAAVEIHEMSMAGGVMTMRELADGLEIPAHGSAMLSPGGNHLMFTGLKQPLRKGETAKVTLVFEHAGPIVVDFTVGGLGGDGM